MWVIANVLPQHQLTVTAGVFTAVAAPHPLLTVKVYIPEAAVVIFVIAGF